MNTKFVNTHVPFLIEILRWSTSSVICLQSATCYPLPPCCPKALQITKPATSIFLTKLGYPCTLPWAITFISFNYSGLGFAIWATSKVSRNVSKWLNTSKPIPSLVVCMNSPSNTTKWCPASLSPSWKTLVQFLEVKPNDGPTPSIPLCYLW